MIKIDDLLQKYRKKLTGKEWYHQRFDGSPMFIFAIAEAEMKKEARKPKGTEAEIRVCFFSEGKADWYLEMQDVRRAASRFVMLAKRDPSLSQKLLKKWRKDEQVYERYFRKIFPKIELNKLSIQELADLWHKTYALFINRTTSTILIDHFALGTDEIIGRMLRKEAFGPKAASEFKESQFTEVFSIATAPVHQSFINQAEIGLLKMILGKSRESLADHQKRWYWSKNNYVTAQILDARHFQNEIKAWKKSGKDLALELLRIQDTPRLNRSKKQAFLRRTKLSPLLRTLLKISEDFTWWQDERKKATYYNIDMGCKILSEVGRRTGFTLDELKYAYPAEVKDILFERTPSRQELRNRQKSSAMVITKDGFQVLTGEKAQRLKEMVLGEKHHDQIRDFRGLPASTGKAFGPVKIVKSATEVSKVRSGDILVAVMTRPDYVTAMKKAAAIVTNEGGITSHAAIVSRELGIPCIIGTKVATEILRDGDMVEVDANHGIVKKIS